MKRQGDYGSYLSQGCGSGSEFDLRKLSERTVISLRNRFHRPTRGSQHDQKMEWLPLFAFLSLYLSLFHLRSSLLSHIFFIFFFFSFVFLVLSLSISFFLTSTKSCLTWHYRVTVIHLSTDCRKRCINCHALRGLIVTGDTERAFVAPPALKICTLLFVCLCVCVCVCVCASLHHNLDRDL